MAKITSDVTEMPASCRSELDHMEAALAKEDCTYSIADISSSANDKIRSLEKELCTEAKQDLVLVAYEITR